jgi:hypothetical protein
LFIISGKNVACTTNPTPSVKYAIIKTITKGVNIEISNFTFTAFCFTSLSNDKIYTLYKDKMIAKTAKTAQLSLHV